MLALVFWQNYTLPKSGIFRKSRPGVDIDGRQAMLMMRIEDISGGLLNQEIAEAKLDELEDIEDFQVVEECGCGKFMISCPRIPRKKCDETGAILVKRGYAEEGVSGDSHTFDEVYLRSMQIFKNTNMQD